MFSRSRAPLRDSGIGSGLMTLEMERHRNYRGMIGKGMNARRVPCTAITARAVSIHLIEPGQEEARLPSRCLKADPRVAA